MAASAGIGRAFRAQHASDVGEKRGRARFRIRDGLVRCRRLMGVHQHARLWADASGLGGSRDGGLLCLPRCLSGNRTRLGAQAFFGNVRAASSRSARVMDDHRMAARLGLHRLSVARERLCAHRWSVGRMGADARRVRHHAGGGAACGGFELVSAAQARTSGAPVRLACGGVCAGRRRWMVRSNPVLDEAGRRPDRRAAGTGEPPIRRSERPAACRGSARSRSAATTTATSSRPPSRKRRT